MQELHLKQSLTQRLTPQQIQLIKLLQVPAADIRARIEQELSENPVLEQATENNVDSSSNGETESREEVVLSDYLGGESYKLRYGQHDNSRLQDRQARRELTIANPYSLNEQLLEQLDFLRLDVKQHKIGQHLIGSLESNGYIRRDLEAIVNDLAFGQYIETDVGEVEAVLKKIQNFDPPGIAARNLQECLLIQLHRGEGNLTKQLAIQIVTQEFGALVKKHYEKLAKRLGIKDLAILRPAIDLINKLNPKPGAKDDVSGQSQILYPDFIVSKPDGRLQVALGSYNIPQLGISKRYKTILLDYPKAHKKDEKFKEASTFIKQKLEAAKWFIEAIKQRQKTLLHTMQAIVKLQYDFFMEEEEQKLKPMILKNVAAEVKMDVSTISRIVNNKSVQTDSSIYPLKFFFTEAISTHSGGEVSNRAVKQIVARLIQAENKHKPYSDDKLASMLQTEGYHIARRTVAKYREQLSIPVARLRKEV